MLLSQDIELQELCNACTNLVYIDHLGVANQDFAQSRQITITMEFLFRHVIEHSEYIYIYSYKPFQQTFLFEMHNIYTLACLSTMFLGYLFRHCFAIFVPNFWEFMSLTFASFCP